MGEKLERSEVIDSTSDNTETTWDDLRKIPFPQETSLAEKTKTENFLKSSIDRIRESNLDVDNTLVEEYMNSELFDMLGDKNVDITSIKPVQEQLLKIPEESRKLFVNIVNVYPSNENWRPYFMATLNSFNNEKFSELLHSVSTSEQPIDIDAFSKIIMHKDNYLGLSSAEDLGKIDTIVNEKIDEARINNDTEAFENFSLLKKYNLSLDESKILVQKYGYKVENVSTEKYAEMRDFLGNLKQLVVTRNINDFESMLENSPDTELSRYPDFQIGAQRLYSDSYRRELFNPSNKEIVLEDGVKIVDAGTNFKMIVRSDGAFSNYGQEKFVNYAKQWNRPSRATLSFSTSLISANHLFYYGTSAASAENPTVTYGFSNIDDDAVVENSLGDDATIHRRRRTLDVSSYNDYQGVSPTTYDGCGQRFMSIDDMIDDSSSAIHTETVMSRFYIDENGIEQRRQPDYVVYIKTSEKYHDDLKYEQSKKAAADFGIPVVIVDAKRTLSENGRQMGEKVQEMQHGWSVDKAMQIIQQYSNNAIRQTSDDIGELVDKYFPTNQDGTNILESFVAQQFSMSSDEDGQKLFDNLMVLNAKKKILSNDFMVNLVRKNPNIQDKVSLYEQELIGVTVRPQNGEGFDEYLQRKACYEICDENGISPAEGLLRNGSTELQRRVDVCKQYGVPMNEETLGVLSYNLEESAKICQEYNIEPTQNIVVQSPHKLRRKVQLCRSNRIEIDSSVLEQSYEQLEGLSRTSNSKDQKTDAGDDFGDFSNTVWENVDWDEEWQ